MDTVLPRHHPAGEVLDVGEAGAFEDHTGLAAAVAATAIANHLFVFPTVDIIRFHVPDPAQREKGAADVELGVFAWFADVQEVQGFAGVEPGFEFFNRNGLHNIK